MNRTRIAELHEEVLNITVNMAEDPRTRGPGYIAAMICSVLEATDRVNGYLAETDKAISVQRNLLRLKRLEQKELRNEKLLSNAVRDLDGLASGERAILADRLVEDDRLRDAQQRAIENGAPIPDNIPTLDRELMELENLEEDLNTLRSIVREKKAFLKQCDSDVRLQNAAIETEAKLFGPTGIQKHTKEPPAQNQSQMPFKVRDKRHNKIPERDIDAEDTWKAFLGESHPNGND